MTAAQRLGRRTYIVDRGFQLKYTYMLAVLGALFSLFFGGLMWVALRDTQQELVAQGRLSAALVDQTTGLMWLIIAIALLMGAALGLLGVLITHRVAGPIYVMSHYVSVLAEGRYPIMRPLRKSDELQAFFGRFQSAVETMRVREAEEADLLEKTVVHFEALATDSDGRELLESLRTLHAKKRDATDRVDIGGGNEKNAA